MERNHFIYIHTRLDKNEVFYVGLGTSPVRYTTYQQKYHRAFVKIRRNRHWNSITKNIDYKIEIIFETNNLKIAKEKEIYYISLYGRNDLNKGNLCNYTDGGDGVANLSFETKQMMSDKAKNRVPNRKGIKLSEETKNKLRIANLGKVISEETRMKMSKSQKLRNSKKIKIEKIVIKKKRFCSEETKKKIGLANSGRKMSESQKLKISNSKKGKTSWNKGLKFSEESKLKMSIAAKNRKSKNA